MQLVRALTVRRNWCCRGPFPQVEPWWIWTEDAESEHFHHTEYFLLNKKQKDDVHRVVFTIPIFEPLPPQYFVK